MSEQKKPYTLNKLAGGSVAMSILEFSHLAGELTNFGVDVLILEQTENHVTFILQETSETH
jgi:hypothetical protein